MKHPKCGRPVEPEVDVEDDFARLNDVLPDVNIVDTLGTFQTRLEATGISVTRDLG